MKNQEMRIKELLVGKPIEVPFQGKSVSTAIFKSPIDGPVWIRRHNIEGDKQADLRVHGGEHKAVYAYALEHYAWWRKELKKPELPLGFFGENLTISNFDENSACVGDHYQVGEAVLEVAQPRQPCFKQGIKAGDQGIVKTFLTSGRLGISFRVVTEGVVKKNDLVKKIFEHPLQIRALDVLEIQKNPTKYDEQAQGLLTIKTLCPSIRRRISAGYEPR